MSYKISQSIANLNSQYDCHISVFTIQQRNLEALYGGLIGDILLGCLQFKYQYIFYFYFWEILWYFEKTENKLKTFADFYIFKRDNLITASDSLAWAQKSRSTFMYIARNGTQWIRYKQWSRRRWRLVSSKAVVFMKLQNDRDNAWKTITKFVWHLGSSPISCQHPCTNCARNNCSYSDFFPFQRSCWRFSTTSRNLTWWGKLVFCQSSSTSWSRSPSYTRDQC